MQKTVDATEPFTPEYFNQELQGIADASGVDFKRLQYVHMLGELTKGMKSSMTSFTNYIKEHVL